MDDTQIPAKFNIPFANNADSADIRPIPQASQIGITPGAASLFDGFPPVNFIPVGAGGIPPFGQDFNGLFFQTTAWVRWLSAGGPVAWDSTFSTALGGYPKGSIVASAVTFGTFFLSTADNNTTNPDAAGAGWVSTRPFGSPPTTTVLTSGSGTYTPPAGCTYLKIRMIAAGGGGGGNSSDSSATDGSDGGTTSFGTVTVLGGKAGKKSINDVIGAGGINTSSGTGTTVLRIAGADGQDGSLSTGSPYVAGSNGASSVFGGAGAGRVETSGAPAAAKTNTGSGGAGAGMNQQTTRGGGAGAAGEYAELLISGAAVIATAYVVGALGAKGLGGTNGVNGGDGASGQIIIEEHYD